MAKILYGGSIADVAVERIELTGGGQALDVAANRNMQAHTAITGGTQVTDLALYQPGNPGVPGGAAPSGIFTTQSDGYALVWAEDTLDELWVTEQGDTGRRFRMFPVNMVARLIDAETTLAAEAASGGGAFTQSPLVRVNTDSDMIYWGHNLAGMVSLGGGTVDLHDTADVAIGTEAAKVTTPINSATACGFAVFTGSTLPDLTGKEVVLWLKIVGMANTVDFTFWIGGTSLTDAYIWNLNESGTTFPFLRDGDWYRVTLPFGKATINGSAPNLTTLNSWQLKIHDNSVAACTLRLGGIGYVARQTLYPNGVVTIRFDDLLASTITKAAPIMSKYGYRATSYVIAETLWNPGAFSGYATLDDAYKLEELFGWEHASHANLAAVHNQTSGQGGLGTIGYTAYTAAAQLADMKACRDYLRSRGFRAPDHFATPQGAWDATVRRTAKQVFSSHVTVANHMHESVPPADPSRMRCYAPPNGVSGSTLTAEVDKAIAGDQWLTVLFHNIIDAPVGPLDIGTASFTTFVDHLATNNVAVRLVSEVLGT